MPKVPAQPDIKPLDTTAQDSQEGGTPPIGATLNAETLATEAEKEAAVSDAVAAAVAQIDAASYRANDMAKQQAYLDHESNVLDMLRVQAQDLNTVSNVAQFLCGEGFNILMKNHAHPSGIPQEAMRDNARAAIAQAKELVAELNAEHNRLQDVIRKEQVDLAMQRFAVGLGTSPELDDEDNDIRI